MSWIEWYSSLAKPGWTPAPATIGLVWEILYPIILVTFGFVFVQFAINLVANLIFTPIQFGMRNLPLASVDILAEEVVRRSPAWRCTLVGGVLEQECNALFEAASR